ncbi:MAG: MacB family efflux pump subunit [Rhodospirillum sp.]|nr:MacB family efflux pump subunit [Rhodospirillum sp.]
MERAPFIELRGITRSFTAGEGLLTVLKDVDLTIQRGEMVAIIGASGSGKSTLMNILGLLDRPSGGAYRMNGRDTASLGPDALAALRREHFGFIFQRYHLLGELDARGNVEIPATYAGLSAPERRARSEALLDRLGMADRLGHRPGQLSGGQQQRVSIARALMNGAEVILADEPTGALDSHSGAEVLRILDELHGEGHTVILVTHDPSIAERAERIIEIKDGEILSDRRTERSARSPKTPLAATRVSRAEPGRASLMGEWRRLRDSLRMALLSMRAHKVRTFLTMLGITNGIASVVCVVALGEGSRQKVLSDIQGLGTNTLEVFPGGGFGDVRSGKVKTLVVDDAEVLKKQPYVSAVTPTVSANGTARRGSIEANALVNGVGEQYFDAEGMTLLRGRLFDEGEVAAMAQNAVIDDSTAKTLYANEPGGGLGEILLVDSVPSRVVGVVKAREGGFGGRNNLNVYLPYTTVQARFTGSSSLRGITVRVADDVAPALAEQAVIQLLTLRHGSKDFFIINTDDIRETITSATETLTLMIAAIAVISLLVGGIGVMNILLVTVSERVGEIGIRMAVGARRGDILRQFLIEAVLVCLIGGVLGIGAALGFGVVFAEVGSSFTLVYSTNAILLAVLSSTVIGVVFGYLPARNASRLDPVVALTRD